MPSISFAVQSVPVTSQKLAGIRARGSSTSCPDLSALQISHQHQQSIPQIVTESPSYGVQNQGGTQPYPHSPSSDTASVQDDSQKPRSARKRVSKKARGVLGKVRTFPRIAAAKMAHPTIKIDTNIQATKRRFPDDNDDALEVLEEEGPDPGLDAGDNEDVPPFLCQPVLG